MPHVGRLGGWYPSPCLSHLTAGTRACNDTIVNILDQHISSQTESIGTGYTALCGLLLCLEGSCALERVEI